MDDFKMWLVGIMGGVNALLTSYFGGFTPLLILTLGLMFMDLVTRIYAAAKRNDQKVESKKVMEGIYKKLGMVLLIILALMFDAGLKYVAETLGINVVTNILLTAFTLAWIFVRELISNAENLQLAGITLPSFITKALNIAKDKIDSAGDSLVGGNDGTNNGTNNGE